jgi:electron transport complex, RnfABCDGE type, D subunit
MADVLIALLPTVVAATVIFGLRALLVCGVCVLASVLSEYIYRRAMGLSQTAGDFSAAVTGLLLAFNLPSTIPYWMAAVGCVVAVIVAKQIFGGLGRNFANPAIVGRIVLLVSFAGPMTTWALPRIYQTDALTGATPLAVVADGLGAVPSYVDMFLGTIGGSLGETCKLTLLVGTVYLIARKVITPTAPVAFIGGVFAFSLLLGQDPVFHVLAGGVILGACFMATDYVTTPTTELGKAIFGIGCALITMLIRLYAAYPEGVSFAILLMNLVSPHIDSLCVSKPFGGDAK